MHAAVKPFTTKVGNRLLSQTLVKRASKSSTPARGSAAKTTKDHLKVFHDALSAAKQDDLLLEYCVMMWGLTKPDAQTLVVKMKEQYNLNDYEPFKK